MRRWRTRRGARPRGPRSWSSGGSLRKLGRAVEQWATPAVKQGGLEGRAGGVQTVVLGRRGEELDAGRQAVLGGEACGDRHPGHAGEVGRDGGDIVEVHGERVVELLADGERRGRRGRRDEYVGDLEGAGEV